MYSKTPTGKNTKGKPSLETYQGRLRIRFRVNGQQKTFSLGLADTDENRVKGESIARQMQLDMLSDNFDSTLGKYKPYMEALVQGDAETAEQLLRQHAEIALSGSPEHLLLT